MKIPSKKGLKKVTYGEFKDRLLGITDYCMKQFEVLYKISDSMGVTKLDKSELEAMLDNIYDPRYGTIVAMNATLREYIKNAGLYKEIEKTKDDWEYYVDPKTDVIQAYHKKNYNEATDDEECEEEDKGKNAKGMFV